MPLLVTSAAGANGNGYGLLLAFDRDGTPLGSFGNDDRIVDPRGLAIDQQEELLFLNSGADWVLALDGKGKVVRDTGLIEGLNPGGGNFGPDGRYYVGLRSARTIMAFPVELHAVGEQIFLAGVVPFPRGFAFGRDGRLFLASGIGANGEGDNTIIAFAPDGAIKRSWAVSDPDLSPLDLAIAPNDNIVVSSEHPFGRPTPSPPFANTTAPTDTSSASCRRANRRSDFRNPAQWRQPADRLYREILDQIAWGENNGFDDVWLSEHHFALAQIHLELFASKVISAFR